MTKGIVEAAITEADVFAFRALANGTATPDQQKQCGNWLLTEGARLLSDTYAEVKEVGGDTTDVIFALGRRHVGVLLREMLLPSTLERARKLTMAMSREAQEESSRATRRRRTQK